MEIVRKGSRIHPKRLGKTEVAMKSEYYATSCFTEKVRKDYGKNTEKCPEFPKRLGNFRACGYGGLIRYKLGYGKSTVKMRKLYGKPVDQIVLSLLGDGGGVGGSRGGRMGR